MTPTQRRSQIEALFLSHARGVGSYVYARTANPELAEAITSRVFLIVVRNFDQCKGPRAPWLWSIVRSELARHFRDQKNHAPLHETIPDRSQSPIDHASQTENQLRIKNALETLSEEDQRIVYLKFFQGMTNKQIAADLSLTPTNVGVLVHRALKQLRVILTPRQEQIENTR